MSKHPKDLLVIFLLLAVIVAGVSTIWTPKHDAVADTSVFPGPSTGTPGGDAGSLQMNLGGAFGGVSIFQKPSSSITWIEAHIGGTGVTLFTARPSGTSLFSVNGRLAEETPTTGVTLWARYDTSTTGSTNAAVYKAPVGDPSGVSLAGGIQVSEITFSSDNSKQRSAAAVVAGLTGQYIYNNAGSFAGASWRQTTGTSIFAVNAAGNVQIEIPLDGGATQFVVYDPVNRGVTDWAIVNGVFQGQTNVEDAAIPYLAVDTSGSSPIVVSGLNAPGLVAADHSTLQTACLGKTITYSALNTLGAQTTQNICLPAITSAANWSLAIDFEGPAGSGGCGGVSIWQTAGVLFHGYMNGTLVHANGYTDGGAGVTAIYLPSGQQRSSLYLEGKTGATPYVLWYYKGGTDTAADNTDNEGGVSFFGHKKS